MQVVAQAVEATGGFDDASLATYVRSASLNTVMGAFRFGLNGEWAEPRVLQVQFQRISGHGINQFQNGLRQIVLTPTKFASGEFRYPYAHALSDE
jgi:branched-chain amino acid transport system substrate-binding protein